MKAFLAEIDKFEPKQNIELAPYTTWKIGGPAKVLVEANNSKELLEIIEKAKKHNVKYIILGGGSNVLVPDRGLENLVIINKSKNIEVLEEKVKKHKELEIKPRHSEKNTNHYADFKDEGEQVLVKLDSGYLLPAAIAWTLKNNLTGLQWFSGIPGTVGGALYNNIHGARKHFSDYFYSATVFDYKTGETKEVSADFFEFGYDQSILRKKPNLVVLDVTLKLFKTDAAQAKEIQKKWIINKKDQPKKSSGCIFKNLTKEQQEKLNLPTPSTGYLIDKVLNLGGYKIGGAEISKDHANFIINTENAKSEDVIKLVKIIKQKAEKELNLELETEINIL